MTTWTLEDLYTINPETPPEGYVANDLSVPMDKLPGWVTMLSIVLLIIPIVIYVVLVGLDNARNQEIFSIWTFVGLIALIIIHELVHGSTWKFVTGYPWSAFKYGVLWKVLTPYCHAKIPMTIQPYRIGAMMPLVLTGILPWIIAIVLQNTVLAIISAGMISAAVGDIYIWSTLRGLPDDTLVSDHPSQAGCIVYVKETA